MLAANHSSQQRGISTTSHEHHLTSHPSINLTTVLQRIYGTAVRMASYGYLGISAVG